MADAKAVFRIVGEDATAGAFRSALGNARQASDKMGKMFKTAIAGVSVAAVVTTVGRAALAAVEYGDSIGKASAKSGIGAQAFSELAAAAKMADIDLAALSTGLKKMQVGLSEAGSGSKSAQSILAALGLTFGQLQALEPDRQFEMLAERISMLKDPADRARAATELFGKAGADLLPLFEQGAEGIRKARMEAEQLGLSLSEEDVGKLQNVDDAIKRLNGSWDALALSFMTKAAPAAASFVDFLRRITVGPTEIERITEELASLEENSIASLDRRNGGRINEQIRKRYADLKKRATELGIATNSGGGGPNSRAPHVFPEIPPGFKPEGPDPLDALLINLEKIRAMRIEPTAMQSFYKMLNDATRTTSEQTVDTWFETKAQLDALWASGGITAQQYNARQAEALDNALQPIEVSVERIKPKFDEMSEYAKQASRNMQDALANFLFDPFENGLRGMVQGFATAIRQMIAQAAAAEIFKKSGLEKFVTTSVAAWFGGGKAVGGPVSSNRAYLVGERGPEIFKPSSAGSIVPNNKLGGSGTTIAPVYNIDARGATQELAAQLPGILEQNNRALIQTLTQAMNRSGHPVPRF